MNDASQTRRYYWSLIFFAFLAFCPTLRLGFFWDDHETVEKNEKIRTISLLAIKQAFSSDVFDGKGDDYYRPIQTLANMIDYRIWKLNPFGYHLTNLLFHILSTLALFSLLNLLFEDTRTAFSAAVLFAVNPIVVEQFLVTAGRAELMSLAFVLLTIWLSLLRHHYAYLGSLACYALACFSKESGVVAPLGIGLIGLLFPSFRRDWKRYIGYAVICVTYLVLRSHALASSAPKFEPKSLLLFLGQDLPTIFTSYVGTFLFPTDLHSHRRMVFYPPWMFVSPILWGLFVLFAIQKKSKELLFGLGWFLIGFLPKLPLLATNSLMLDHWAYVSGIGACVWLAWIVAKLAEEKNQPLISTYAIFAVVVAWVSLGWLNIYHRKTDKELYQWALRFPTSSIVRANLGLIYYQEHNYVEAISLERQSLAMRPDNPGAQNILALALWKTGKEEEGLKILDEVLVQHPEHIQTKMNRDLIMKSVASRI